MLYRWQYIYLMTMMTIHLSNVYDDHEPTLWPWIYLMTMITMQLSDHTSIWWLWWSWFYLMTMHPYSYYFHHHDYHAIIASRSIKVYYLEIHFLTTLNLTVTYAQQWIIIIAYHHNHIHIHHHHYHNRS